MPAKVRDQWQASETYESFMGRWSRPLAEEFVRWLDPEPHGHWLDVGTGTGAVVAAICALAQPSSVVGCDPSSAFIDSARARPHDSRARFEVAGADQLPLRPEGYDAVVSGLALNFFPDPHAALESQLRAARPGGCIAAFVWDYSEGMEFLRVFWDAATTIDAGFAELDEAKRFPLCNADSLRRLFLAAGAQRVRVDSIHVATVFSDFDDYWRPFLGGVGPAPSLVATLSERRREALATELRGRLQTNAEGSIEMSARAWAVVGERPSGPDAL